MIQTRRVFETTNTLVNYLFLILVLLFAVFAGTCYFSVIQDFTRDLNRIVNTFAWTIAFIGAVLCLWAIILGVLDKVFPVRTFIWNIFRTAFCLVLAFGVNALDYLLSGRFEVIV